MNNINGTSSRAVAEVADDADNDDACLLFSPKGRFEGFAAFSGIAGHSAGRSTMCAICRAFLAPSPTSVVAHRLSPLVSLSSPVATKHPCNSKKSVGSRLRPNRTSCCEQMMCHLFRHSLLLVYRQTRISLSLGRSYKACGSPSQRTALLPTSRIPSVGLVLGSGVGTAHRECSGHYSGGGSQY